MSESTDTPWNPATDRDAPGDERTAQAVGPDVEDLGLRVAWHR
jgi:hypothetical protein